MLLKNTLFANFCSRRVSKSGLKPPHNSVGREALPAPGHALGCLGKGVSGSSETPDPALAWDSGLGGRPSQDADQVLVTGLCPVREWTIQGAQSSEHPGLENQTAVLAPDLSRWLPHQPHPPIPLLKTMSPTGGDFRKRPGFPCKVMKFSAHGQWRSTGVPRDPRPHRVSPSLSCGSRPQSQARVKGNRLAT